MRVSLQPAYVLHSRPYRDSSALLEVLSAEFGRIGLVARGARRRTRGGSGNALLQPFTPLLVSFSGRGELKTLTATEAAGSAIPLRGERMFSGLYVNELLVRLMHRDDPNPRLFAIYAQTLADLHEDASFERALRQFEFSLLDELGYSFDLAVDGHSGEAIQAEGWYQFHPEIGLVAFSGAPDPSRPAFAGSDLLAMADGEFGNDVRQAAKRLLRQALASQLGETPLHSRELFRAGRARPAEQQR